MLGVCALDKHRTHVAMAPELIQKLDEYRAGLVNRPSRNFIIAEACIEYLRLRGIEVQHVNAADSIEE